MKGKPFLVAIAAFVIVLFGGVAIAGVGSFGDDAPEEADVAADHFTVVPERDEPKETTTTTKAPKEQAPSDDAEKVKDEASEDKQDESKEEKSEEKDDEGKDEKKDDEPVKDDTPVDLFSLTKPADGTHVTSKVVTFGGTAKDGVTVHRGKYTATPSDGKWSMELVLSPGKNKVSFKAIDANGNTEVESVTVYYDAPQDEEKPKDPPKDVKFTANQKYGSCGEAIPYDKFWGTAQPGATIKATSPYGSGSTKADEKGNWYLKVKFPDAPVGETFKVTITSTDGGSATFKFTNTGSGKDH